MALPLDQGKIIQQQSKARVGSSAHLSCITKVFFYI